MKVKFIVSLSYNMVLTGNVGKNYTEKDLQKVKKWSKKFETDWRKKEKKILNRIEKYNGFDWKLKEINCFIVEDLPKPAAGISSPLTVKMGDNNWRIKLLTHELIHYNTPIKFRYLINKSKNPKTFTHIPVYLVLNRIAEELFPKYKGYVKSELNNKLYKAAIDKSIELEPLWIKSKKNIYQFMKHCLEKGLVD
ncbi:MAG: hypothetical protein V1818_03340 [Candidatus Aenigmatarchaeota archaeon]